MTPDDLDPDADHGLERRVRGALAVIADDVPVPRPPDLPRMAAIRRRRRTGAAAAVLAAAVAVVAVPAGWSALRHPAVLPGGPFVSGRGPVAVAGVLTVTCTPGGTVTDADHVQVSADGVHLRVVDRSGRSGSWLSYSGAEPDGSAQGHLPGRYLAGQDGSVPVSGQPQDVVVLTAPPALSVSCVPDATAQPTDRVVVTLDDPHGLFRQVDVEGTLGCSPDQYPFTSGAEADTLAGALDRLTRSLAAGVRLLPGPGYRARADLGSYLAVGPKTRAVVMVGPAEGGRYQAVASSFCTPGSWKG